MTFLAICCFALVTWTIVVTGQVSILPSSNVSFVYIDDTKSIDNLNITLTSIKAQHFLQPFSISFFLPHFFKVKRIQNFY